MFSSKNQVQIIGYVAKNVEVATTSNNSKYARISVPTTEKYKTKDGKEVEETTWHNFTLWGAQAELAEKYIIKGTQVIVNGRLVTTTYVDKTGATKSSLEIRVAEINLLGRSKSVANVANNVIDPVIDARIGDDGLPF